MFSACDFIAPNIYHRYAAHSGQALSDGALLRLVLQQDARAAQGCGALASVAIEIIKDRAPKARRIPSRSWRELIKKVWEVDPLLCPKCHHEMRIVSLINDAQIIERILRHVGSGGVDQWVNEIRNHGVRISPSTGPPTMGVIERGQLVIEPWLEDPMPDYDCDPPLWQV